MSKSYSTDVVKIGAKIRQRNQRMIDDYAKSQQRAALIGTIGNAVSGIATAYGQRQQLQQQQQGNAALLGQLGVQGVTPEMAGNLNSSQLVSAILAKRQQDQQAAATSQYLASQGYGGFPSNIDPQVANTILSAKLRQQAEQNLTPLEQARLKAELANADQSAAAAELSRWRMQNPAAGGEMSVSGMKLDAEQKRLADPTYRRGRLLEYKNASGMKQISPALISRIENMSEDDFIETMKQFSIGNRQRDAIDSREGLAREKLSLSRQQDALKAATQSYRMGGDLQKAKAEAASRYMASRATLGDPATPEEAIAAVSPWFSDPGQLQVPGQVQAQPVAVPSPASSTGTATRTVSVDAARQRHAQSGSKMPFEEYVKYLQSQGIQVQ